MPSMLITPVFKGGRALSRSVQKVILAKPKKSAKYPYLSVYGVYPRPRVRYGFDKLDFGEISIMFRGA
jgi:hypothetical protein